ncbi:MAG: WHG domain-containing protein [Actinomycetota bacterium]|nr:WHG domain-containing protein [Actinomycetota bacterium]MDP9459693.1 WHG domain-containing protein [Actinomycetota bacterium]
MTTGELAAPSPAGRSYHHGDLRRALLDAAAQEIAREGPAVLSLRALARAAAVSHAAPAHHFGDKRGLLTALATEGHRLLAEQMRSAVAAGGGEFLEAAVAYVRFAVTHPAHFAVMFRPDLLHGDDPELTAARRESRAVLQSGSAEATGTGPGSSDAEAAAAIAAWSLVHGLATLHLTGNLPPDSSLDDLEARTRAAAAQLFSRSART